MRRLSYFVLLLACVAASAFSVATLTAQESTPEPPPRDTAPDAGEILFDLEDLVRQAEQAAADAEESAGEASEHAGAAASAIDHANDLFGLFEAMSGAVGLVVPVLAIAGAFIGFNRLQNAEAELREARENFEKEAEERNRQLDEFNRELEETAEKLREASANASLALALLQLGERQYQAQDYQGALDTYQRALEIDDRNPITYYRMGYVHVHSDRFAEAQSTLTRSLELDASFMPSVAALGYTYRRIGDKMDPGMERDKMYNRAEEYFLRALELFPKLIDEDGESWWGSLGGLYRRRGQVDQAINAYEKCADATPRSSYAYSNLALLYGQKREIDKMITTYGTVEKLAWGEIQSDPDNYWAYADLITARLAQGKVKETYDVLETALNVAPAGSPYTLQALVDTLVRLGNTLGVEGTARIDPVLAEIRKKQHERYGTPLEDADDAEDDDTNTDAASVTEPPADTPPANAAQPEANTPADTAPEAPEDDTPSDDD